MNDITEHIDNLPHDLLFAVLQPSYTVYALKAPMFYQDSTLGGQENVTKLKYNEICYKEVS